MMPEQDAGWGEGALQSRSTQMVWTRPMLVQAAGGWRKLRHPALLYIILSPELHAGPQTWPDPAALEDGRGPCEKWCATLNPLGKGGLTFCQSMMRIMRR